MTANEFNEKYKDYVEDRFTGLEFHIPGVTEFLDEIFEGVFIHVPNFKFAQIKLKFNYCCFYADLPRAMTALVETKINELVHEWKEESPEVK